MKDFPGVSIADQIAQLANDVGARAADLLRLRSESSIVSRADGDGRLMNWLGGEASAEVHDGIVQDPWTHEEVSALARSIRTEALIRRSRVTRIPGRPLEIPSPRLDQSLEAGARKSDRQIAPWVELAPAAGAARAIWDEDCDSWVELPRTLPRGNYVALNVKGESMLPLLHDGDVVLVDMAARARIDDVVLARIEDGYVVKRLAENSPAGIVLESLNASFAPIEIRDSERTVAGVVVLRWCDDAGSSG